MKIAIKLVDAHGLECTLMTSHIALIRNVETQGYDGYTQIAMSDGNAKVYKEKYADVLEKLGLSESTGKSNIGDIAGVFP